MLWSNVNTGLNLIFLFFFGKFMYDNEFETMGNEIWTKNKVEPQHLHTQGSWWFKQSDWFAISDVDVIFTGE